uniref:Uncharacterized protein n=1 Tax=Glossina brevipalpis TaxID=37001 RepID=A0A1A9WLE8_9MUSC
MVSTLDFESSDPSSNLVVWFHGVMVSTLDSESSDPSSNLGGTFLAVFVSCSSLSLFFAKKADRCRQVPPRFELGSLDSESRVLTITPWNHTAQRQFIYNSKLCSITAHNFKGGIYSLSTGFKNDVGHLFQNNALFLRFFYRTTRMFMRIKEMRGKSHLIDNTCEALFEKKKT